MIICHGKTPNNSNIMTFKHQMENCTTSAGAKKPQTEHLAKVVSSADEASQCLRSSIAAILVDTVE